MSIARKLHYTYEQYLEIERRSDVRHEYLGGEIYAMAGGTPEHALLMAQVSALLSRAIPSGCRVASSDLKIAVETTGLYTYPDASVICGPLARDVRDPHAVTNPRWLVEVTSDSTEDYDRGAKLAQYQAIASLEAVIFVSHRARRLTVISRAASGWETLHYERGATAVISQSLRLPVDAVYETLDEGDIG